MHEEKRYNALSNYYLWIWWILSFGLLLLSRIMVLNQLILWAVIPLLFIATVFKSGFSIPAANKGFTFYFYFFLWACLSLMYSVNIPLTVNYLQAMIGNLIIWFVVATIIFYAKDIYSFLIPLVIIFTIHAYFGITIAPEVVSERVVGRAQGLTSNANGLGFLMWYGIVVGSLLVLLTPRLLYKLLIIGAMLVMVIALFKSGSRKCLAAVAVFALVSGFLLMKKKNQGLMILLLLLGVLVYNVVFELLLANTTVGARLTADNLEGGAAVRLLLIRNGIDFFLSSPVVGIGLGSFSSFSDTGQVAHNDYIEIAASMGIPGLLLYMAIFYDYYKKSLFLGKTGKYQYFFVVAAGFGVGYLFLGTGRPAFLDPWAILMFAMFHGFLNKIYQQEIELEEYEEYAPVTSA